MAFKLAEAYVQLSQKGFSGVLGGISRVRAGLGGIVSFATGPLGLALGGIGGGAAAIGLTSLAADLETTTTQFKTLLGSAEEAKRMIEDLQRFSASTPFQMAGLSEAAKTLLAFGTDQRQIIPTMQVLGDVAAATGNQVGDLANIYGKVRARGALMTEQLDQFNERAIPVGAELAKIFGMTEAEIRDMASKGEISFGHLQYALESLTAQGGIAFEGMKAQSQTLGGLWSTLRDNLTLALTDIGNALVEGFDLKTVTTNIIDFVQKVRSEWLPSIVEAFKWMSQNIITPVTNAIGSVAATIFDFVSNADIYWKLFTAHIANAMMNAWEATRVTFINMGEISVWAFNNIGDIARTAVNYVITVFQNLGKNIMSLWDAVLDFFATGRFSVDFTPLTEGFKSEIKSLPQLTQAEFDKMRPEIDALHKQMEQREQERERRRMEAIEKSKADNQTLAGLEIDQREAPGSPGSKKTGSAGFQTVGVSQLAESMQQAVNKQEETKLQQRQVTAMEGVWKLLQTGIAVTNKTVGAFGINIPSHEFGEPVKT